MREGGSGGGGGGGGGGGSVVSAWSVQYYVCMRLSCGTQPDECVYDVCVQVNPERVGFYRVSYSSELFLGLRPALSSHTLSARDRLGLQNDAFAMVSLYTVEYMCV